MSWKLFPWSNEEKPYWVNPENGFEWYIDKECSDWCKREHPLNPMPILDAVVFFVCERKDGKVNPLNRVLIDVRTNEALHYDTSIDGMCTKIDVFRLSKSFENGA